MVPTLSVRLMFSLYCQVILRFVFTKFIFKKIDKIWEFCVDALHSHKMKSIRPYKHNEGLMTWLLDTAIRSDQSDHTTVKVLK